MHERFIEFEADINKVLTAKLEASYFKITKSAFEHLKQSLKTPIFVINGEMNSNWGEWHPDTRHMVFSNKLIRNFEWAAVEEVMKHETAHQIVSEVFKMDCRGISHGQAWEIACKAVNIEPSRTASSEYLKKFKSATENEMVDKIRKLMVKGNDRAVTKEESQLFLTKAQELMMRHNISLREICGNDRLFVQRAVGNIYKRFPVWIWDLARLVSENYNVKYIRTYYGYSHRIELYGEPHNLDVAEYVYHALINQATILYNQYKNEHQEKMRVDAVYKANCHYKRISPASFFLGLIRGYSNKLNENKQIITQKIQTETNALIPTKDGLLEEMYDKEYTDRKNISTNISSRGMGYHHGSSAGYNLRLSKGVNGCNNGGRLLN